MTPNSRPDTRPAERRLAIAALVILSIPLCLMSVVALLSTRHFADDYCYRGLFNEQGFWRGQVYLFENWSGRFGFNLAIGLALLGGPFVAAILPAASLIALVAGGARGLRHASVPTWTWMQARMVATGVTVATLSALPNLYQTLLWQPGVLTYVAPLAVASLVFDYRSRNVGTARSAATAAAFALLAAFSEISGAAIVSVLLIACAREWRSRRPAPALLAATGGALLGLVLLAIAPGNYVRKALAPAQSFNWYSKLRFPFIYAGEFVVEICASHAGELLTAAVAGAVAGSMTRIERSSFRSSARRAAAIAASSILVLLSSFAVTVVAVDSRPPTRAMFLPILCIMTTAAMAGAVAGLLIAISASGSVRAAGVTLLVACLSFLPLRVSMRWSGHLPGAAAYGRAWDRQHALLDRVEARGEPVVFVRPLPPLPLADVREGLVTAGRNPDSLANRCMAEAYRLQGVSMLRE